MTDEAMHSKIEQVGGAAKWSLLLNKDSEQDWFIEEVLLELTTHLGEENYKRLSDVEKTHFDLFLWVGCMMHKLLNTVIGGIMRMSKLWAKRGLCGPVLLPNCDNNVVLVEYGANTEDDINKVLGERPSAAA